ncbi:glycosyltransferase family 2 protein [Shimia sp. R9_3]|uniref:glycosyltransferase family 2 protein n=1 Tax=Shimia sp. R9_3 TaxID=2821113 RepID=UPI001ADA6224|nr:glycosyltransferase family 2 protein [Shimia sp. R9_3]MBO9403189.1 glycosyltransferase family 2 protein [Shimia sp. R9_3]
MTDATVIIAAWNAKATIIKSVSSALGQRDVKTRVVIIDDASDEDFEDQIPVRNDVIFERLAHNGGPAAARNAALNHCEGNWICVLDSDDTMQPDRLKEMITYAEEFDADVLLGNFQKVDEQGHTYEDGTFLRHNEITIGAKVELEEYVSDNIISPKSKSTGYLKPIFRRSFIEEKKLEYNRSLRNGEDCHLIFEALAMGGRVLVWPKADYLYTVRRGSISHRIDPDHFEALIKEDCKFVDRYHNDISNHAIDLFSEREIGLRKMMETERIMSALKSRQVGAACRHLSRHPYAIPMVGHQLLEAIRNRIT